MLLFEPDRTPYDLRWRMFGIDVRVHPMFWLVMAILGYGWYDFGTRTFERGAEGSGAQGLAFVALWVLAAFISILLHELGHVVAMRAFGSRGYIVLYGFGGLAVPSSVPPARWQRVIISLAGPGAQLLLLGVLWLLVVQLQLLGDPLMRMIRFYIEKDPAVIAFAMLWAINLFWPILNLLPIWPLDGGMVTRELCEGAWRNGRRYSLVVSIVTAGVLAAHILMSQQGRPGLIPGLNAYLDGYTPSPLMALFFILFAVQSYQALQEESHRRRNWDDDNLPWERR